MQIYSCNRNDFRYVTDPHISKVISQGSQGRKEISLRLLSFYTDSSFKLSGYENLYSFLKKLKKIKFGAVFLRYIYTSKLKPKKSI